MIQRELRKLILPLLLPALFLHTVFFVLPVLNAFYYSLTSWSGISPEKEFIGLANFARSPRRLSESDEPALSFR